MKLAQSKVHFIGIGGIGMCGLAELLHNMGATVTGSDLSESKQTQYLKNLGIKVFIGHEPEHVGDVDVVVYSSAVRGHNPEYLEAKTRKIPLIPRAEALAEMMRLKRGVAIAGTHGKTTTTSLAASVFLHGNLDPTIVVGGRLDVIKSTAKLGEGEWLIAEADESDGSFSKLSPEVAIITNIDEDHLDYYDDVAHLHKAFFDFANRIPFYGKLIACGDDENIKTIFKDYSKQCFYYGFEEHNDYRIEDKAGEYKVYFEDKLLGNMSVPIPGRHNALNALAAMVAGLEAGISFEDCAQAIKNFQGVDRRFQFIAEEDGIKVYDDYGHHPTEIKAVMQAFKEKYPSNNLYVFFQPHRYSRTELCWNEFVTCFGDTENVYVLDVYAAGELPVEGIHSQKLVSDIGQNNVQYLPGNVDSLELSPILKSMNSGDVVVTLGAGSVWKLSDILLQKIKG